jgi:hypothetical protein
MTPHEKIMKLAAVARREQAPVIDVTTRVGAILAELPSQPMLVTARPLAWMAAAASVAAVVAVVAALQFGQTTDSITEMTNSIAWVIR